MKGDSAKEPALREQATGFLRVRMWGIDADERHRNALAAGDLILIYLGAPARPTIPCTTPPSLPVASIMRAKGETRNSAAAGLWTMGPTIASTLR
jgi:hypothetical protein